MDGDQIGKCVKTEGKGGKGDNRVCEGWPQCGQELLLHTTRCAVLPLKFGFWARRSLVSVSARTLHVAITNPVTEGVGAIPHCLETRGHFMVDSNQHDFCHFWVPVLDHVKAISPT